MSVLDPLKLIIRRGVRHFARDLDRLSRGRLTPNAVTIFGSLMHLPIAWLIGTHHFAVAGVLLILFGLFDTLDGELARVQDRASARGMLLDASTDRMKETVLYTAIAYVLATGSHPGTAAWAAAAVGASLCVSYVKAKGEAAVASARLPLPHDTLNRLFKDGLLTFELRMALLVIGLLFNQLLIVTILIAVLATFTALQRLVRISRHLT